MMAATAVALWLHARGLGVYDPAGTSGDLFIDVMPSTPAEAVMVNSTGGLAVDGGQEWGWSTPTVQLLARGGADPRVSAQRLLDVLAALPTLASTVWTDDTGSLRITGARAVQGEPVRVGQDDNGRHRHSINLSLDVERAAG